MARNPRKPKPRRRNKRTWTGEEDNKIMEMVGVYNYDTIGIAVGRSERAVQHRLLILDTEDKTLLTGMMTAADLGRLVKRDKSYIIKLIREHGLPATQPNLRFKTKEEKTFRWMIDPDKFWKWAEQNRDKLNFHQIDAGSILPEPNWVEEQRRIDFQKPVTRKRWTEEDKKRAIELLDQGYTRVEVAKVFNRSTSSIRWVLDKHLEAKGIKK